MSTTKEMLESLSAGHVQNPSGLQDTEMTGSLTPKRSDRSRSSSPITETMNSYHNQGRASRESFSRPAGYDTPGNWRTRENAPSPSASNMGNHQYGGNYSNQYDPNAAMMGGYSNQPRPQTDLMMTGESSIPLSRVCPGNVWPTEEQVNTAYAYGLLRDDGTITRLIPADDIGGVNHIPPHQGAEGLIIVPPPRQMSPNAMRGRPEPMIPNHVVAELGNLARRPAGPLARYDPTQAHIDGIVAQSQFANPMSPPARRREKIYCDKWIHEGVCAFTQMGCKYKHEMPTDKVTQLSLGLNHGFPNWYRRAFAIQVQPQSPESTVGSPPSTSERIVNPWRRSEGVGSSSRAGNGSASSTGPHFGPPGTARNAYGPIGPPPAQPQFTSSNTYSNLKNEGDEEEEGEDLKWRGRQNH